MFLTLDETRKLLNTAKLARDVVLFWSLAYGLRIAEVFKLKISDISARNGDGWGALTGTWQGQQGLNGADLPGSARLHLFIYRRSCGWASVPGARRQPPDDAARDTIQVQESSGRSRYTAEKHFPHSMRHGFATRMLFDTKTIAGIYTVSKLLGHSQVAVTEMYLHCSQKQLEQAMLADPLGAGV